MPASQRVRERVGSGERTSEAPLASEANGAADECQYLDEGLHIAVKQLTVKNGARSTLPHSVGFRGQSGRPGETPRWVQIKERHSESTET